MQVHLPVIAAVSVHSREGCALKAVWGIWMMEEVWALEQALEWENFPLTCHATYRGTRGTADAFGRGCSRIHKGPSGNPQL